MNNIKSSGAYHPDQNKAAETAVLATIATGTSTPIYIDKAFAVNAKSGETGARVVIVRAKSANAEGRKTYTAAEAIALGVANLSEGFGKCLAACDGVFSAKAARRCDYVVAALQAAICADRFGADDERTVDADLHAAEAKDAYERELASRLNAFKAKERKTVAAGRDTYIQTATDRAGTAFDRKVARVEKWDKADKAAKEAAK